MKENKQGVIFTTVISATTFLTSIIFTLMKKSWWINFSFALFGSSIITLFICGITYKCLAKKSARDIALYVYNANNLSFTNLYSCNGNTTLEQIEKTIGIAQNEFYKAYVLTLQHIEGMCCIGKKTKSLKSDLVYLKTMFEEKIISLQKVGFYIEHYPDDAKQRTKQLYDFLDKEISDKTLYTKAIKFAKNYISDLHSEEEKNNSDESKKQEAYEFKNYLEEQTFDKISSNESPL